MLVLSYWTWSKTTRRKKQFFWSNPYKIEVVITFLIVLLQLTNFGHMTTSILWFESWDKHLLVTSWLEIMTSYPLFQNGVHLRRLRVAIFADIIKIVTMLIKTIIKDSRNVKIIRNSVSKSNLYLYFLMYQNLLISGKKVLMSAKVKGCVIWFIHFLDLVRCNYHASSL